MKSLTVVTLVTVGAFLSPLTCFAQEKTEKTVAFRTTDAARTYVSAAAGGSLNTSGTKLGNLQTFVLVDLNGGELTTTDSVQIKFEAGGTRTTYWQEDGVKIKRVGGKLNDMSVFQIKIKEKATPDALMRFVLQTASGKFVEVSEKNSPLVTTDKEADAVVLELVATTQLATKQPKAE